jgi:hypothetical protein
MRRVGAPCLFLLLILMLSQAGCGESGQPPERPVDAPRSASAGETSSETTTAYPFRSAVIVMENSLTDGNQTMYIDDHGRRTATYTTVEMTMFGETIRMSSVEIYRDGWQYNIDLDEGTGTRTRRARPLTGSAVPDVARLTAEMRDRYKFKELGRKEILGRMCDGYEMEAMGMKIVTWNWHNIPMYSETDMGGTEPMVMRVVSIETDVAVPSDKFDVPPDMVITEV